MAQEPRSRERRRQSSPREKQLGGPSKGGKEAGHRGPASNRDESAGGASRYGTGDADHAATRKPFGNHLGKMAVAGAAALGILAFAIFGWGGGGADAISDAENQRLQQSYQTFLATPGLEVDMVGADEMDRAIESMPLAEEQREQVREQVQAGQVQLAWLTLWDTHAEDGDVLRFESDAALPVEVTALNTPTTLAIPYPASGTVKVIGVVDGGGGITIALKSGAAQISWPTMRPGDSLDLPVTPGL
jgi:hypothetical protein